MLTLECSLLLEHGFSYCQISNAGTKHQQRFVLVYNKESLTHSYAARSRLVRRKDGLIGPKLKKDQRMDNLLEHMVSVRLRWIISIRRVQ